MTNDDYAPFLINDRSNAILHLIDSFQLTESELNDIYDGVFNRMKDAFAPDNYEKPLTPYDVRAVRDYVATLRAQPISQETADWLQERRPTEAEVKQALDGFKELSDSDQTISFEVHPLEAYMILGMIQASIVSLNIPENLEKFGRDFVGAFCDRYRITYPDLVKTLELGWTVTSTSQEFDDLIDSEDDSPNLIEEIWEDKFIA